MVVVVDVVVAVVVATAVTVTKAVSETLFPEPSKKMMVKFQTPTGVAETSMPTPTEAQTGVPI